MSQLPDLSAEQNTTSNGTHSKRVWNFTTINEDSPRIPHTLRTSIDDEPKEIVRFYVFVIFFDFFSNPRSLGVSGNVILQCALPRCSAVRRERKHETVSADVFVRTHRVFILLYWYYCQLSIVNVCCRNKTIPVRFMGSVVAGTDLKLL